MGDHWTSTLNTYAAPTLPRNSGSRAGRVGWGHGDYDLCYPVVGSTPVHRRLWCEVGSIRRRRAAARPRQHGHRFPEMLSEPISTECPHKATYTPDTRPRVNSSSVAR